MQCSIYKLVTHPLTTWKICTWKSVRVRTVFSKVLTALLICELGVWTLSVVSDMWVFSFECAYRSACMSQRVLWSDLETPSSSTWIHITSARTTLLTPSCSVSNVRVLPHLPPPTSYQPVTNCNNKQITLHFILIFKV